VYILPSKTISNGDLVWVDNKKNTGIFSNGIGTLVNPQVMVGGK
jgi:hypothetical protein